VSYVLSELAKRVGAAAILAVALLAGCESKEQRFRPVNLSGGKLLPGRQYPVGGGLNIAWQAPSAGTVFLVEKRTGKLVETRSLEERRRLLVRRRFHGPGPGAWRHPRHQSCQGAVSAVL